MDTLPFELQDPIEDCNEEEGADASADEIATKEGKKIIKGTFKDCGALHRVSLMLRAH